MPGGEALLGALDRGQLVAQVASPALVELVLVEVGRLVACLDVLVLRLALFSPEAGELALDPLTLGGQELTCAVGIHRGHPIRPSAARATVGIACSGKAKVELALISQST